MSSQTKRPCTCYVGLLSQYTQIFIMPIIVQPIGKIGEIFAQPEFQRIYRMPLGNFSLIGIHVSQFSQFSLAHRQWFFFLSMSLIVTNKRDVSYLLELWTGLGHMFEELSIHRRFKPLQNNRQLLSPSRNQVQLQKRAGNTFFSLTRPILPEKSRETTSIKPTRFRIIYYFASLSLKKVLGRRLQYSRESLQYGGDLFVTFTKNASEQNIKKTIRGRQNMRKKNFAAPLCGVNMDQITIKTPNPKCRLY